MIAPHMRASLAVDAITAAHCAGLVAGNAIGIGSRRDRASTRRDIENWIKSYDERRLCSALGDRPSNEARRLWQEHMSTAA